MLHKFKVKKTGTTFYYDNETNALFDSEKRQLSLKLGDRENRQAINVVDKSGLGKSNAPTEIKIVFGHKCNYACGYCVQRDVGDHDAEHLPKKEVKSRVEVLIEDMKANLDLSRLEQMELWGGEIFLFWKDVVKVIEEFDREGFDWVVPTNGTLLTKSHVEFFSNLKGRVTIELSHDGPGHEKIRGKDFLRRKAPLLKLMEEFPEKIRVTLNVVLSKGNFNFLNINDYFNDYFKEFDIKPFPITYMPLIVYDDLSRMHSFESEIEEYEQSLSTYLDEHIDQFKRLGKIDDEKLIQTSLFHVTNDGDDNNGVLQWASKMKSELDALDSSICGMHQSDKLVLDINGNIKACQNVGETEGDHHMKEFSPEKDQITLDGLREIELKEQCDKCLVKLQCLGGCLLKLDNDAFDRNCKLSLTHNKTMLLKSMKLIFNSEVEWHGVANN